MPHHPDDNRYQHLPLLREEPNPDRRRRPAPPSPPPNRGGRTQFAGELRGQVDQLEAEIAARPASPAGIKPHLVFRVPLAENASPQAVSELLERLGISVVSIESDKAIIAFRDDGDLTQFRTAIASFEQGPQAGINPQTGQPYQSTQWDVLQYIEAAHMRLWGRTDRIGRRLAQEIGDQPIVADQLYVLDIELWHQGTDDLARAAIQELRKFIEHQPAQDERLCDSFTGQLLCLARVMVRGLKLDALLNLDIVAEAERPPQPVFDNRVVLRATPRDFPAPPLPPPGGPGLCIADSGIVSNHPLLARNVGHEEAVMSSTDSVADEHGHGTMVGGIAVFGDIRACFESGVFASPITLFSARVLNADNRFDDATLIIHQMRRVIEIFTIAPYDCHVFNLSLGGDSAWLTQSSKQSLWAESLDTLAREFNVVLVVSAGNHNRGWSNTTTDAEEILTSYPQYLFEPECGLCEPATAAIPITVGGFSDRDIPSIPLGRRSEDIIRTIAAVGEPTPTTRIGPGIGGAIKPEFVAPAGNQAFQGVSTIRRVDDDRGCDMMSLSHEPTRQLFAFDNGTSFAAPRVARSAAILWNNLEQYLGEAPQANLVRAVLASAAQLPVAEHNRIHEGHTEEDVRRVYGYGMIDEDVVFESADRRVTLIYQGVMPLDTFAVYEVPAPAAFRAAPGKKHVTVSLAFDPPVRRRRAEYLGVKMDYGLIRGKTLDEIVEAYRHLSQDERTAGRENPEGIQGAFQSPFKCGLKPGPQTLQGSTLQQSRWTFSREGTDYGESWYLVIRAQRTWAPDTFTEQQFAVAVTLQADEPQLFNLIRNRIRVRQQQRARARG